MKTKQLHIRVTEHQAAKFHEYAEKQNESLSKIITNYLDSVSLTPDLKYYIEELHDSTFVLVPVNLVTAMLEYCNENLRPGEYTVAYESAEHVAFIKDHLFHQKINGGEFMQILTEEVQGDTNV